MDNKHIELIDDWLKVLQTKGEFHLSAVYRERTGLDCSSIHNSPLEYRILKSLLENHGLIEAKPTIRMDGVERLSSYAIDILEAGGWHEYHRQRKVTEAFTIQLAKSTLWTNRVTVFTGLATLAVLLYTTFKDNNSTFPNNAKGSELTTQSKVEYPIDTLPADTASITNVQNLDSSKVQ
jgi:hypothetical protein